MMALPEKHLHALRDLGLTPAGESPLLRKVRRLDYRSGVDHRSDWAWIEPSDNKQHCWVVNLHGHGSHGDQLYTRPDIRDRWLPLFRSLGFGILCPNLRDNAWMGPTAVADLHALLHWLSQTYCVRDVLLVSASMGGAGNLIYATHHPQDVAGVVAMCPATNLRSYYPWCRTTSDGSGILKEIADAIENAYGGSPAQQADLYERHAATENTQRLQMPVYIVHGDQDETIPVSQARAMAEQMSGSSHFRYKELPGGDHESPIGQCEVALRWVIRTLDRKSQQKERA